MGSSVVTTVNAGGSWSALANPLHPTNLTGVSCVTAMNCTAVGGDMIAVTANGGSTWTEPAIPATTSLLSVTCPSALTCQVGGIGTNGGAVLLTLPAPPRISTAALATGTIGVPYNQTLSVSGGKAPYVWSISSGSLPSGLVFNAGTGTISGTPTLPTSQAIGITVTDANNLTGSAALVLTVNPRSGPGYWEVASDGGIFTFGGTQFFGSTGSLPLNRPIVGMAATPDDNGYWLVASDGGIFAFGDAVFYGSTGSLHLKAPIVGMQSTPSGHGYWLVASDGGIFAFGDAQFYGSTGSLVLDEPIVAMAPTADGRGYWLVASDGGVFAFGDAPFLGSTGGLPLNRPIVGMASNPLGGGYWLVASDGGIFSFGNVVYYGSTGSLHLNRPIVGMARTADGKGYWMVATDGGIFAFGDASFFGSTGALRLNRPVVGMAAIQTFA